MGVGTGGIERRQGALCPPPPPCRQIVIRSTFGGESGTLEGRALDRLCLPIPPPPTSTSIAATVAARSLPLHFAPSAPGGRLVPCGIDRRSDAPARPAVAVARHCQASRRRPTSRMDVTLFLRIPLFLRMRRRRLAAPPPGSRRRRAVYRRALQALGVVALQALCAAHAQRSGGARRGAYVLCAH